MIILLFLGIIIIALFLIFYSHKQIKSIETIKKKYNIPSDKIVYTDLDKPAKPLFHKELRLVGKPDYIVKKYNNFIPIEVKSGNPDKPYKNHVMQLAAYCLLIEENYNTVVPYGVIQYDKTQSIISFTEDLKSELKNIIEKMRSELKSGKIERNHNIINKCSFCSLKNDCDYKLF